MIIRDFEDETKELIDILIFSLHLANKSGKEIGDIFGRTRSWASHRLNKMDKSVYKVDNFD